MSSFALRMLGVAPLICLLSSPVSAQQTSQSSWQGTQPHLQSEGSSASQPTPAPPSSQGLMLNLPQDSSAAHPQMIEVPPPQSVSPAALQPELVGEQERVDVSRNGLPAGHPAYLGITYDTSPSCRYPAGVRVKGMFEGSPAQRAGLRAEGKVRWYHALTGLLAISPVAPLAIPLIMSADKDSGPGDIILAVDGERVRKREEFEQTMGRFQPRDVVYFSVLRKGSILQVPIKLEEFPSESGPSASLAKATAAKGKKVYLY